jgi:hypothetical protein
MAMPNALEQVCVDWATSEKHWWPQQLYSAQLTNVALLKSQPIPPSVREILTAYTAKGSDADREVLLAILQAKAAEDQVRPNVQSSLPARAHLKHRF